MEWTIWLLLWNWFVFFLRLWCACAFDREKKNCHQGGYLNVRKPTSIYLICCLLFCLFVCLFFLLVGFRTYRAIKIASLVVVCLFFCPCQDQQSLVKKQHKGTGQWLHLFVHAMRNSEPSPAHVWNLPSLKKVLVRMLFQMKVHCAWSKATKESTWAARW